MLKRDDVLERRLESVDSMLNESLNYEMGIHVHRCKNIEQDTASHCAFGTSSVSHRREDILRITHAQKTGVVMRVLLSTESSRIRVKCEC